MLLKTYNNVVSNENAQYLNKYLKVNISQLKFDCASSVNCSLNSPHTFTLLFQVL